MKYYSLMDKVYSRNNLEQSYLAVRANRGAPGIDGQTVDAYGENLKAELDTLQLELKTGTYKPKPAQGGDTQARWK